MPRLALVLSLAAWPLLLGGCGRATVVGPSRTLRVTLMEYRLRPDRIQARPGPLTLEVRNLGRLTHNLAIFEDGRTSPLATTAPVPPGGAAMLSVTLVRGTYTIASTIQEDRALGEHGTLTIEP